MNTEPNANHSDSNPSAAPLRRRITKMAAFTGLLAIAAVVAYSIYIGGQLPDSQETVILGQTTLAADGPAGLRILVRNRLSGQPVPGAQVALSLASKAAGTTIALGNFTTDASGSVADAIRLPAMASGDYQLTVDATSRLGRDHITKPVTLQQPARILLSVDKPIYQPGQTIHLRTLLLNGRTEKPFTNETVTFEISDPKGNKVFKETRRSSGFGIASADFVLATELNLGRYELRALAGATTAERTVEVRQYVLPKFKLQITTDKTYYLPGETVSGSIRAGYFFGQAVAAGSVKLTASTFQEKPVVIAELPGQTDAAGNCAFRFVLPDFFAGMPQNNGRAFLDLTASVRDTAGHEEEKTRSLPVAQNELEVTALPEAGTLIPGVENILYVLTAYPDGQPAKCRVFVNGAPYQSDAQGVCELKVTPTDSHQPFEIQAIDPAGKKQKILFQAAANRAPPAFLLRTDRAVYPAGETAHLSILSPETNNTVFIDVIKDGQTVLTKSVPLAQHQATYALSLPPTLVGMLQVNAYIITAAGEDRGCRRSIYVNPASGLHIATQLSQAVYRPGEMAKLNLTVTDAEGRPTPAALGIAAVDESVFALAESRPGLWQQFLDVESDLLKPRYQIKRFDSPAQVLGSGNQALAAAFFASLEFPSSGPTLEDMVRDGILPQKLVDHAREMQGTPAYEKMRQDPQFATAFRLLEGSTGTYNFKTATGPAKVKAVEAQRKAYFNQLRRCFIGGFLGLLFLSPMLLLIYYSHPGAVTSTPALAVGGIAQYFKVANTLHRQLGILVLLPVICYPLGFIVCEVNRWDNPGWLLLGLESLAVLLALHIQYRRMNDVSLADIQTDLKPLRVFLWAFLVQFVISRLGIAVMVINPRESKGFIMLWFLASLVAPLVVLGASGTHIRRRLAARGIDAPATRMTIIDVLVVIAVLAVLAAMLLPALACAKKMAQSISFVNDLKQIDLANRMAEEDDVKPGSGGSASPRVRRDFPETLLWRPEVITDDHGQATVEIPLADSITTWRASVDGISAAGKLGSTEVPITVFQDFFVGLDLPVSLSLGDQVSVPVTAYNYLKEPQTVHFTVASGDWFESPAATLTLQLGPNEVKSVNLPLTVRRVGQHTLRVTAQGTKLADAIEREIRVVPTGERFDYTKNTILKAAFADTFTVPAETIPASPSLGIKFYPSHFSEVVEGLDAIFEAPHGCFEQTSSTTYPNVLVLDYLQRLGKLTPEIGVKARQFINTGYQRLLTFEVPGGGFEWFGRTPAHVGLTAYGILEFTDMNRILPVDQAMLDRTVKWLRDQQSADGSWSLADGLDHWSGKAPVTAYVAWALAEAGDQSDNLNQALSYLRSHPAEISSLYEKALAANAFLAHDRNDAFGRELVAQLLAAVVTNKLPMSHWPSSGRSLTYSYGAELDTECTALCALALMKSGTAPQTVKQALAWLSAHKNPNGAWGSTQATILAMRALLQGSTAALGQEFESTITVRLNGQTVETFRINKDNSEVMKQINLSPFLTTGANQIQLQQSPAGELPVQLAGAYWLPAAPVKAASAPATAEPLAIQLQYDRTTLAVNDPLNCTVTVKNNSGQLINMAMVDLGIPPGFTVDTAAFEALQARDQIAKFEVTGSQIILYLRGLSPTAPFQFNYSLRAQYPLRVQTPPSTVYEYYQPQNRAVSKPVTLQATGTTNSKK